ncbi:hypothetical protein KQY30_31865 [Streptomyces sp. GMY02]|uniref:hypothetical protein n=1 Tax=Streptomyces sp. GMY02 TaxID=1333528 RepID=UPI001C2BC0C0|nr:hypothetical protein [Streptomyces sp. GMY02]QXE38145.1 hypothetical protein KQY30_31865 [Streptomyces sp. GMY02]
MGATRREVTRDVVAVAAPQELPVLQSLQMLDEAHITRLLSRQNSKTDPLGFGLTEAATLVTPVVWLVVSEVINRGAGMAADSLFARLQSRTRSLLRRSQAEPAAVPPLSAEQLDAVHRRVLERAADAGIEGANAQLLADAVVSRLARESQ